MCSLPTMEGARPSGPPWSNGGGLRLLVPALRRLDEVLQTAVAGFVRSSQDRPESRYRGLYLSEEDLAQLLARGPTEPPLPPSGVDFAQSLADLPQFAWLGELFGLTHFDLAVLLIALAPEIDLRYERIYAYLQDDVTRKSPTVDVALSLLCPSAEARAARWGHFSSDAPLVRSGLLHLTPDAGQTE